jgi:hypothetical protein
MSNKRLVGWLVAVQGPKDPMPRLYAAVAQQKAYPSLENETAKLLLAITCQSPTSASNFNDALPMVRSRDFGWRQARSSDFR